MPFILRSTLFNGASLGIWQTTETEEALLALANLTEEEMSVLSGFRNVIRRKQWIACRILAAKLSGDSAGRIRYRESGQPVLGDGSFAISLSHAGDLVAAIVSEHFNPGIDIELLRDRILRVKERFMSDGELERISEPAILEKLYIHWSAKEALYKLYGGGPDIRDEIILHPFDYLCTGLGQVGATVYHGSRTGSHHLQYMVGGGWILVYVLEPRNG